MWEDAGSYICCNCRKEVGNSGHYRAMLVCDEVAPCCSESCRSQLCDRCVSRSGGYEVCNSKAPWMSRGVHNCPHMGDCEILNQGGWK